MAQSDFDKFFLNLPPFDREKDFDRFWKKATEEIKKIPLDAEVKKTRGGAAAYTLFDVTFHSFMKTQVRGKLYKPKIKKPCVVIIVHDYNEPPRYEQSHLDHDTAYFFIELRGHGSLAPKVVGEEEKTPGYMIENILDKDTYYLKALYLDVLRSIDMLRLISDLDCSRMGIIGRGLGASAALFAAVYSDRVMALAMDSPSFCYLTLSQNISTGAAAEEINDFISRTRGKKNQIKTTLSYFDALNFSDKVKCPVLVSAGFKDTISPPACTFSLFNHLLTEKTIEVYPDAGHEGGGEKQFKKTIRWVTEQLR